MNIMRALLLFLVCSSVQAAYQEQQQIITYDVFLRHGQGLYSAVTDASPLKVDGKIFMGYTSSKIKWSLQTRADKTGCRLSEVTVMMDTTITLPLLRSSNSKKQKEFAIFLEALHQHENGHLKLNQAVAKQLESTLLTLPPQSQCQALLDEANAIGDELMATLAEVNREFDRRTEHGANQGVVLSD